MIKTICFIFAVNLWSSALYASCSNFITTTTPNHIYIVNSDGTVIDSRTKLMWKRCPEGFMINNNATITNVSDDRCDAVGSSSNFTWQGALQQAQSINNSGGYANNTDWRVPNIKELASIADIGCSPAINNTAFPDTPLSIFWSSSPRANLSSDALLVSFNGGGTTFTVKTNSNFVYLRLVRNIN